MFTHYLKIAFRNLWKYKMQSAVNIFGLAFGVTCFVFGLFWIRYETSYNGFFPNAGRMYVMAEKNDMMDFPIMSLSNMDMLKQIPEFEQVTWQSPPYLDYYGYGDRSFYVPSVKLSPNFFEFFVCDFIEGSASSFSGNEGSVVITEQLARKFFADEPAVGKVIDGLRADNKQPNGEQCTVSGVIKDWPKNCTFDFDMMMCGKENFRANFFVLADKHADINQLNDKLAQTTIKSLYRDLESILTVNPIGSLHYKYYKQDGAYGINFIAIFFAAGLIALLSALFNFVTLNSGILLNRSKEAVLRVTLGAGRSDLTRLFLAGILTTAFAALVASWILVKGFGPLFTRFSGIPFTGINQLWLLVSLAALAAVTLASIFPIARLNHRNIANAFAGGKPAGTKAPLRRVMIVLQLVIGSLLIMVALTVFRQIIFMNRTDTGIDVENVAEMQLGYYRSGQIAPSVVISGLNASPYIEQTVVSTSSPIKNYSGHGYLWEDLDKPLQLGTIDVADSSFFDFFRFKLKHGRFFETHQANYCVINQAAAKLIGTNAIGSKIQQQLYKNTQEWEICGVVQDIYCEFRKEIKPTAYLNKIFADPTNDLFYFSRVYPQHRTEGMSLIKSIWLGEEGADGSEGPCLWLEDQLRDMRKEESAMFILFSVLSLACIIISLFGIYSFSALTTRRRRKEVAIRKVGGAEAADIVRMFFREYLLLAVISNLIALPVAWRLTNRWLQEYAYHTNISWWLFAVVLALTVSIVLLTVLGQVMKTANENPAEVVKSE